MGHVKPGTEGDQSQRRAWARASPTHRELRQRLSQATRRVRSDLDTSMAATARYRTTDTKHMTTTATYSDPSVSPTRGGAPSATGHGPTCNLAMLCASSGGLLGDREGKLGVAGGHLESQGGQYLGVQGPLALFLTQVLRTNEPAPALLSHQLKLGDSWHLRRGWGLVLGSPSSWRTPVLGPPCLRMPQAHICGEHVCPHPTDWPRAQPLLLGAQAHRNLSETASILWVPGSGGMAEAPRISGGRGGMGRGRGGPLTIIGTSTDPASAQCTQLLLGKYGSSTPVTGFRAVVGAKEANWGHGLSWRGAGAQWWLCRQQPRAGGRPTSMSW